jgi:hypothetical protein
MSTTQEPGAILTSGAAAVVTVETTTALNPRYNGAGGPAARP